MTRNPFSSLVRLRHFGSGLAAALLLVFLGSSSTRSSEPVRSATLPLRLDRHFPELAELTAPVPPRLRLDAAPAESARERYLLALPFGREIRRAARRVALDSLLLASVVEAESSFRPDAVSPKGALGLMQLMPLHFEADAEPFDPVLNLNLGAEYLAELKRRFDGDLELALAAYHAGPAAVERFGGLPPYRETRHYVGKVMELWREHQASVDGGLAPAATL
jgi:soluble lytic murein transglycosylase-like protein